MARRPDGSVIAPPTRSPEEIEEEKRKKEAADREQMSWLGRIWDTVSDNFWLIFLAIIAFVVIGPEKMKELFNEGTKLFGNLLDKGIELLPESWQNNLNALLGRDVSKALLDMDITKIRETLLAEKIPVDVVNVLAKDKATFQGFLDVARDANGGKVAKDDFTNDKTVFALLTKKPEMARELAAVALKTDGAATSKAATEIKASLLAMVKDARLDTLLNPPHLDNTKALLMAMPGDHKEKLEILLKDKSSIPALRTYLVAVLTSGEKGAAPNNTAAEQALVNAVTPETRKALLDAEMKVKPTDDAETKLLKTNNGGKALATLREKLGDDKLIAFVAINNGVDEIAKMKFALENRAAFEAFHKAADVTKLGPKTQEALSTLMSQPDTATKPLLAIIANGVDPRAIKAIIYDNPTSTTITPARLVEKLIADPVARATISKATPEHLIAYAKTRMVALPPSMNAQNMTAMLSAAEAIAANPKMKDASKQKETIAVLAALTDAFVNKDSGALNKISKDQFADFFADKTNSAALETFLQQSTLAKTQDSQGKTVQALLEHWQLVQALAADKENGAGLILGKLSKIEAPSADSCKPATGLEAAKRAAKDALFGGLLAFKGTDYLKGGEQNIIGRNPEEIKTLIGKLSVADCIDTLAAHAAANGQRVSGQVAAR